MGNLKHYIGYGIALLLLGLTISLGMKEHEARLVANATIATRDAEQKVKNAGYEAQIADLKAHPEKAVPLVNAVLSESKSGQVKPIPSTSNSVKKDEEESHLNSITAPPKPGDAQPSTESEPDAPEPKGYVLSPLQMEKLGEKLIACQKTESELSTCKANLNTLKEEKDGGGVFMKVKKEAKCLVISGGVAAVGALAYKKQPALGALGGAVVGGATCKIFF